MGLSFTADDDKIVLDGVSSDAMGLYFDYLEVPPMAQQRKTKWSTRRDEDGFSNDDTYENLSYPFSCFTFMNDDYYNSAIYRYFAEAKKLEIARLPDWYYKIVDVRLASEQILGGKRIGYKGTFELSPFRYKVDNDPVTINNNATITYNGTRYGKPVIFGVSGTAQDLIVNCTHNNVQERLTILNCQAGETIYIDTERKIVHDGTNILFNRVDGVYPTLQTGENTISWDGQFSSAQLIKNERGY